LRPSLSSRDRTSSRGQSLVELAIVLPVLLLLLMSILQIGFLLFTQVGLTNAAREAARNASAIPVATTAAAGAASAEYYARLTNSTDGFLRRNVGGYSAARLIIAGTPRTEVCYYSFTDASGAPAVMARVQIQYSHPLFIPLIAPILDGVDGTVDGGYRLGATIDIRVGNAVLTTTNIGNAGSPTCSP
jgi:Flp pilus assembly protein TadG